MDLPIDGVTREVSIAPARSKPRPSGDRERRRKRKESATAPEPEARSAPHRVLQTSPIGHAPEDEAGSRLDVTA